VSVARGSGASAPKQLTVFMKKYDPALAALAKAALAKMRKRVPGAMELVYDNYNALVIGFGPTERASEAVLSIALYPRWVNLFFLQGARLADPDGLLQGEGSRVRRILVRDAAVLEAPGVKALIAQAVAASPIPFPGKRGRRMVIKSVSARQRPRRPRFGRAGA
jgi:hypothetical protein